MPERVLPRLWPILTFDRTYEGLKHAEPSYDLAVDLAFDRTYEGLKLWGLLRMVAGHLAPFDRTYEGLKRLRPRRGDGRGAGAFDRTYEGLKQAGGVRYSTPHLCF